MGVAVKVPSELELSKLYSEGVGTLAPYPPLPVVKRSRAGAPFGISADSTHTEDTSVVKQQRTFRRVRSGKRWYLFFLSVFLTDGVKRDTHGCLHVVIVARLLGKAPTACVMRKQAKSYMYSAGIVTPVVVFSFFRLEGCSSIANCVTSASCFLLTAEARRCIPAPR